ncbi:ACP S-malonyltransferase [Rubinisphaera italica]|uniref:Malonyl CoA-acyl carrier protein transacylase n=1 Tax=Rubinisphaera italica TaxID=2527969 RepID=A0A5C5XIM8_9PLAN|nr:ACP S-malonyltransferase [Rubinisphaera italica]TWT61995.1 Malonyl CoA-acyl carrier protein transacylase [Rubinisphaera italica]
MPKTAFLFPGQGAQQIGMGVKVAEKYPAARQLFDQAAEILGFDLLKLCAEGPEERINATEISQPALYVSSLASLEVVKDQSPEAFDQVEVAAGLSLGEYTALAFAGAMSFEDGLRVVRVRGQAMQAAADATPSGMVSLLLLDEEKVQQVCDKASDAGLIQIANYLCPGNIVVSGDQAACDKVVGLAEEAGGRAIPLKVAGAFHTPIMQSATEKLAAVLESVEIHAPRIPVVSNVDAKTHSDASEIRDILVKQVVHPVLWEKSMNALLEMGVEQFYEIGPGKVLKGLMKRIARKASVENYNDESIA